MQFWRNAQLDLSRSTLFPILWPRISGYNSSNSSDPLKSSESRLPTDLELLPSGCMLSQTASPFGYDVISLSEQINVETNKNSSLIIPNRRVHIYLEDHIKIWAQFKHASELTFLQVRSGYSKRNSYRHVTQLELLKFFTLRFFRLLLRKHCRRPLGR